MTETPSQALSRTVSKGAQTDWSLLNQQAAALLSASRDRIANAANLSALLYQELGEVNWVGFYFLRNGQLVLGPFQGLPACVEIPVGAGVCGTAAATRKVQRVADVHAFAGHIACDANSASEIVLPLERGSELIGVLDVDSPVPDRFGAADEAGLRLIAETWLASVD